MWCVWLYRSFVQNVLSSKSVLSASVIVTSLAYSSGALAQVDVVDSSLSGTLSAVRTIEGSVEQHQEQLLRSRGMSAAIPGPDAYASGTLRRSVHDGLRFTPEAGTTDGFDTVAESSFATISYDIPGTVLGGHLKVAALVGYAWTDLSYNIRASNTFNTFAKSDNRSAFFGGSYVWGVAGFYTMSTFIGFTGETSGSVGFQDPLARDISFSHGTHGLITNTVVGNTFDI